jgi:hypothetical protein
VSPSWWWEVGGSSVSRLGGEGATFSVGRVMRAVRILHALVQDTRVRDFCSADTSKDRNDVGGQVNLCVYEYLNIVVRRLPL